MMPPTSEDIKQHNLARYVYDNLQGAASDPLMLLIARTPVASVYIKDAFGQVYITRQLQELLVFLHKLGLRGEPKYNR